MDAFWNGIGPSELKTELANVITEITDYKIHIRETLELLGLETGNSETIRQLLQDNPEAEHPLYEVYLGFLNVEAQLEGARARCQVIMKQI